MYLQQKFRKSETRNFPSIFPNANYIHVLARALEGGLSITPTGGGAYNAPPPIDLSSYES